MSDFSSSLPNRRPDGKLSRTNFPNEIIDYLAGQSIGFNLSDLGVKTSIAIDCKIVAPYSETSLGVYTAHTFIADDWNAEEHDELEEADLGTRTDNDAIVYFLPDIVSGSNGLVADNYIQGRFVGFTDTGKRLIIAAGAGAGGAMIWVKITGATLISGAANRWEYTWVEQVPGSAGAWSDKEGGLTSADSEIPGYNSVEANNSASGVQGNGIDVDTLSAGFSIQPIRGNPVVKGTFINGQLIFSQVNAVDGECE